MRQRATAKQAGGSTEDSALSNGAAGGLKSREGVSKGVNVLLLVLLVCGPAVVLFVSLDISFSDRLAIVANLAISLVGFFLVRKVIPVAKSYMLRRGMFGLDLNKKGSPQGETKVPESQGLATGVVFLVCTILFQQYFFTPDSQWLVEYNAALFSICFMLLLGFIDDVLDIPWRVKLVLPTIASLPLLMAYAGSTSIVIPKPMRAIVGMDLLELGWIYKVYMCLLAVFCSNSINILAGVNGLEAGQTFIIAAAVIVHNLSQLGGLGRGLPLADEVREAHLFSIFLMQPLLATTLGLLTFNWYPSSVFVGDTFTYFAGMAFAVAGILGHFSETLLLFFLPQVLNFLYSCPQLFKIVPCPRHRLPRFDPATGLLHGSNDLNLVNLFLRLFGPCTEQWLCIRLLTFQFLSCALGFGVRYLLTGVYK